jgi:hypothetical protein
MDWVNLTVSCGKDTTQFEMSERVQFISLEDTDKDIVISFALDDPEMGIKSLILHRTLFFEFLLDEEERGVNVSLEDDEEDLNMLQEITIGEERIEISSSFREYQLDVSDIEQGEIKNMVKLLEKQNYDHRFKIHFA